MSKEQQIWPIVDVVGTRDKRQEDQNEMNQTQRLLCLARNHPWNMNIIIWPCL